MVFRYFFKQKLHFLAMMCVKVCLHMFLLQINQINRIKHSESVSWKQKTRFVCNFHWKISFWSVFRWTQRSITQRRVITLGLIFVKMVLNRAQGLKKKSHEVSARKNNNRLRSNKKCRRGADSAPGSFRVNMVGDCGFILLPCDGCLPLGTRECFFRSFLSLSFMFFQSCSKEARGLTNIGFVTVTARDFIDTVTNLANIPLVLRMYKTVA